MSIVQHVTFHLISRMWCKNYYDVWAYACIGCKSMLCVTKMMQSCKTSFGIFWQMSQKFSGVKINQWGHSILIAMKIILDRNSLKKFFLMSVTKQLVFTTNPTKYTFGVLTRRMRRVKYPLTCKYRDFPISIISASILAFLMNNNKIKVKF